MKKTVIIAVLYTALCLPSKVRAQAQELQQLTLNIEKLAQFKQILSDMKKGYQLLNDGYNSVKDLSKGSFDLHKGFLDGLMAVSPAVRKYKGVKDVMDDQLSIVKEYKSAYNRSRKDGNFNDDELSYMGKVYDNLIEKSLADLDELAMVMTDSRLRMTDDERITAIDRIRGRMNDKLMFLRHFNNGITVMSVQRSKERNDAAAMRRVYGVKN